MGLFGGLMLVAIIVLVLAVVAMIIKGYIDDTYFIREIDMTTIAMFFLAGVITVIAVGGAVRGVF